MAGTPRKKKNKPQNTAKHWLIFMVLVLLLTGTTYAVTRQLGIHWPVDQYLLQAYKTTQTWINAPKTKLSSTLEDKTQIKPKNEKIPAPTPKETAPKITTKSAATTPPINNLKQDNNIQIFFAPAKEDSKEGIDDHFIAFLKSADKSIDAAFYELDLQAVADTLITEHKAGIQVRLITDGEYKNEPAFQSCVVEGIPVVWDDREAFMHNKFAVVDDEQVWTGSTNITTNCMFKNNNNSLKILSKDLSENYTAEFEEMFIARAFGKKSPQPTPYPTVNVGDTEIQCLFSPDDAVESAIIKALEQAKERIDFAAFSFTSVPIAEKMAKRIKAGVKVRGIFEKNSAGGKFSRDNFLIEQGAQVKMDANPRNMHDKFIVVDAKTVITGSYNFSKNAETKNDENCLIVHNPKIAALYLKNLDAMLGEK